MIVDASIVVHWFVPTEFSGGAMPFRSRNDLAAPGIILLEAANVLYKNSRRGLIDPRHCGRSVQLLEYLLVDMVPDGQLLPLALDTALAYKHPVYDCLYLALALERREAFVTADKRLAVLANALGIETLLIGATPT
jgi:predicted nucleic acid-binding protein